MFTSYTVSSSLTVLVLLFSQRNNQMYFPISFLLPLCVCLVLPRRVPIPPAFSFFGTFSKQLRKATISFDMPVCLSVCLSVRPPVRMVQLRSPVTDFCEIV
jgi:hypothetical protein